MSTPKPDEYGRFRVRAKDGKLGSWSTTNYNPEIHVIAPGPASDTYGAALPHKPYAPKAPARPQQQETNSEEETQS